MLRGRSWPCHVLLLALALTAWHANGSAARGRECAGACDAAISACIAQRVGAGVAAPPGKLARKTRRARRSCTRQVQKRCRRAGVTACALPPLAGTTSTSLPPETSSTSSTSTTTTSVPTTPTTSLPPAPAIDAATPLTGVVAGLVGLTVGLDGDLFIHSDFLSTTRITRLSPAGAPIDQSGPLGGLDATAFVGSRLATDPQTGLIVLLSPRGHVLLVHPDTLETSPLLDLGAMLAGGTVSGAWDAWAQVPVDFALGTPSFGDVALRRRSESLLDLFVSATTGAAGGFHFVLRVRLDLIAERVDLYVSAVTLTVADAASSVDVPAGVAVNAAGRVVTTLRFPVESGVGSTDGLVVFSADFPEDQSPPPQFVRREATDGIIGMYSTGMAADAFGDFWIATGVNGADFCGTGGSGSLVFVGRDVAPVACYTSGQRLARAYDTAVSPDGTSVYMTFENRVVRFDVRRP